MEIGFTPNYEDSIIAGRAAARNAFSFWQRYWCWPVYLLLGLAVGWFLGWSWAHWGRSLGRVGGLAASASIAFLLYFAGAKLVMRLARRLGIRWIRQRRTETAVVFSIEADGLQWKGAHSLMKLGFPDIDQIYETERLVGFVSAGSAHYVPKRAFGSSDESRTFVRDVFQRLSDDAKQRSLKQNSVRVLVS
ncbi:YcxB family protein [Mesorhizobium sp. ISC25]|uniref:YcxB family protein n=1 Tax=Mesorhizobium sp. ISC25 TaxID=3077335 RepID=UPI0035DD2421